MEEKEPKDEILISSPDAISVFTHDKKLKLLELLIENEYAIIDLKNRTDWNPGMIKRYLDELIAHDLIQPTRTEINEYGIKLKYYRARAKKFHLDFYWP